MTPDPANPNVFLVGAGPGSPGLLTLRAAEVLGRADLVLYDQLVPERLLDLAPPSANKVCVRDLPGQSPEKSLLLPPLLLDAARAGKTVVRLKIGDPLVFGRGGEEAFALAEAGIPYEVVPGVSAIAAVPAAAGIPVTHRGVSARVTLVSGHSASGEDLDYDHLANTPGTLVVFMGLVHLPEIVAGLLAVGMDADTPAAVSSSM